MVQLRISKEVFFDRKAWREFQRLPEEVRFLFENNFTVLEEEGSLVEPQGKKISKILFEIRVIEKGDQWRALYAYNKDKVILLSFFQKKTQKTPIREIKLALKRYKFFINPNE